MHKPKDGNVYLQRPNLLFMVVNKMNMEFVMRLLSDQSLKTFELKNGQRMFSGASVVHACFSIFFVKTTCNCQRFVRFLHLSSMGLR